MRLLLITLAIFFSVGQLYGEGITFFKGKWASALQEAESQGKLIFLDAYAAWCGPCKNMSKYVFTRDDVGDFYNDAFVNVKVDMEKGEGPQLAKKYKIRAYPTLLFIDSNGEVVMKVTGGRKPGQFIKMGRSALKKFDKSADYTKEYEAGKRSPDFLKKYTYALVQSRKPHLKIANEYLQTQKDLTTPENLKAIFDFALESDSRIFNLLIKHKAAITQLKSPAAVEKRIEKACRKTVKKAIKFQMPSLVKSAKKMMQKHHSSKGKVFGLEADMQYALGTKNSKAYLKASKKYTKKYVKNNAVELQKMAKQLLKTFSEDAKAMKMAEKLAEKAAKNGGQSDYYVTYAKILFINGKPEEATAMAEQAKVLARNEKKPTGAIDQLIQYIQQ